ncbi:protein-glutamine gamma-glutamyltransferase E-like isoform X2 [Bufo bufo]|uniref:protein-glutamine gamma-glutamyltransferase E-like isoform X2 n=1 Tax=Bufo bufo TaxID=8384 RepID=UPI001ABE5DD1|nr:protein-glutamine gamma-glutamyltransferase E-like isoform X2 [Bufo bufo]
MASSSTDTLGQIRMAEKIFEKCKSPCIYEELAGEFKVVSVREVGKDVVLNLSIRSLTTKSKQVNVDIKASSVLYTKKEIHELLKESKTICVPGCEGTEVPVVIPYSMYEDLLTADNSIEVTAVCSCEPYDGLLIIETNVVLSNPKFEIKLNKKVSVNKPVEVDIIFTNPFNKEVSNIVVTAEGSGLLKYPVSINVNPVQPNETVTIPITIKPYKAGPKHLLVDFTTNKFPNAKGYLEIQVHEAT